MTRCTRWLRSLLSFACLLFTLMCDVGRFLCLCLRPSPALAAENLFLRKQLALYQERQAKPRRATNATPHVSGLAQPSLRLAAGLAIVQPATLIRWHRQGFRLFWRWKSSPGGHRFRRSCKRSFARWHRIIPTWGQERIANELLLKLGLRVSPRTVRKYMPKRLHQGRAIRGPSQRWPTFVRNHAQAIVACDFCVAVTATFRVLYVFVVIEHASRRLLHVNVTAHPTAEWTLQQLREAISSRPYVSVS